MDSSFGDRLEENVAHRGHDMIQRNRSGTTGNRSRNEPGSISRYAHQAGDESYDSDGEADDEFERSVFTSHSEHSIDRDDDAEDDEQTDHTSDSDDQPPPGRRNDTPTIQDWAEREGYDPGGNVLQWTEDQVAEFIASLAPTLKQYCGSFVDNAVNGEALVALQHDDLKELGVQSVGHRLSILRAAYEHKIRSGIKIEDGDYIPLSVDDEGHEASANQDDIARIINLIQLRDQRLLAAEAQLRTLKQELDRIVDENRKMREETLPIVRLMKDQRTPLPDPSVGQLPSPRETDLLRPSEVKESKGSSLSRKFSTKKLFLGSTPKQSSPTYPPTAFASNFKEVRDDNGAHLEASAAATAASNHLTSNLASQASPKLAHGQQLTPTSPALGQTPSSTGSFQVSANSRPLPRETSASNRHDPRGHYLADDSGGAAHSAANHWAQASSAMLEQPNTARPLLDRNRRPGLSPSPREEEIQPPNTAPLPRDRDRDRAERDRDNPQVEIFKSFRVSIDDPCRVVLPVALKRYNIADDWRQYALYIVHGDQERCLGLEEKPLLLFKQLDREGRKPMFMLRRHASPQEGWSGAAGSYAISSDAATSKIPGGVL